MKAIALTAPGGPENLRLAEVPDPVPGAGQVMLDVVGAGVNRADLLQRQGFYPPPPGASDIIGLEVSGHVGGQPACALLAGGGYAQKVAVPVGQVMPLPPGVDVLAAAGVPEVACTVYSNLAMTAGLQSGERLLIHGGGSGIGTFAIQWARAIGAHVAVTAGSQEKLRRCAELGADVLVNYREQDFVEAGPFDVILDVVGAKYLDANVRALADGGRLVIIGLQGGVKAELNLGALLTKRAAVMATSLRSRSDAQKAEICAAVVENVWPLYASGQIHPVIDRVLPLGDAAHAHRLLADSAVFGKLVLQADAQQPAVKGRAVGPVRSPGRLLGQAPPEVYGLVATNPKQDLPVSVVEEMFAELVSAQPPPRLIYGTLLIGSTATAPAKVMTATAVYRDV